MHYRLLQEAIDGALQSLGMASVVVLVLESSQGQIRRLELSLAARVMEEGRALVRRKG